MDEHSQISKKNDSIGTSRLEAFSDAVMAVIITIMVLEFKAPNTPDIAALKEFISPFIIYILSFRTIGTYWNNHHHLFLNAKQITGKIMWTNLSFLFWLSLIPFFTSWLGKNYTQPWPTAMYGVAMLVTAFAYYFLQRSIVSAHSKNSKLTLKLGGDIKGKLSLFFYAAAIPLAFVSHWASDILYILVAVIWFIPDRRLGEVEEGK